MCGRLFPAVVFPQPDGRGVWDEVGGMEGSGTGPACWSRCCRLPGGEYARSRAMWMIVLIEGMEGSKVMSRDRREAGLDQNENESERAGSTR